MLARWAAAGAPRGDEGPATDGLPTARPPGADAARALGTPDLVVTMTEPYVLAADGPDQFRTFALTIPITDAKYVEAVSGTVSSFKSLDIDVDVA
jgi:hypothetical protein